MLCTRGQGYWTLNDMDYDAGDYDTQYQDAKDYHQDYSVGAYGAKDRQASTINMLARSAPLKSTYKTPIKTRLHFFAFPKYAF